MRRSYSLRLATLFIFVAVCASWHLMPRHDLPVAELRTAINHRHQESVAAPDVDPPAPGVEVDVLANSFLDMFRARTLSLRTNYEPVENKTDSILQVVSVPLVSYDTLLAASNTSRVNLPAVDDLLLFVERGKDDPLREARVLSFMRTRPNTTSIEVVAVPWQEEVYIVLVDTVRSGLKIRICSIDRELAAPEALETLMGKPSTEWPNMLRTITETREPIPFPATGHRIVTVSADESKAGRHLMVIVRDSDNFKPGQEPDARRFYTFETDKWSSDTSQIPEPPWKLEPEGTEVVAVLPVTRPVHTPGQPSVEQPRCLAVVQQQYRSWRPWQDSSRRTRDAFWVVECGPDCDLNGAVVVGVVHPTPNIPGAEYSCLRGGKAQLIYRSELGRYFLVLTGSSAQHGPYSSARTVRLYELDLDKSKSGAPLLLAENSRDWPAPLSLFAEVRLPYGTAAGGSYYHLNGLHASLGFPWRGSLDASIVMATAPPVDWNEPIEFRHSFNFKTRAATMDTLRLTEQEIRSDRDCADDGSSPQPAASGELQSCELVEGSTKVLKVFPSFRTQQVSKSLHQKRCLVVVEQKYRFLPITTDAAGDTGRAIWILDCTSDCNLKTGVLMGLIHPQRTRTGLSEQVDLIRVSGPQGLLVAMAGAENANLRIQLFQAEAYGRLNREALVLPSDPRKWPPQMTRAAELKTKNRDLQQVDFLSISRVHPVIGFGDQQGWIAIKLADRNSNDAAYRWDIKNDTWTRVVFETETASKYQPQ